MTVSLAAEPPVPQAFPRAAARAYLVGTKPATVGLTGAASGPSPAAVNRAEAVLRRVATSSGARERALARLVLATGEANQGKTEAAENDFSAAAEFAPLRDAAVAGWVDCTAKVKDATGTLAAADKYPIAVDSAFRREIALQAARAAVEAKRYTEVAGWTEELPDTAAVIWLQAQAAAGLGQGRRAGELARTLTLIHPASSEAQLAAPMWQSALASYPDLAPSWQQYQSQAEALAGQPKRAVESWRQTLSAAPPSQHDRLQAHLARALLASGDRAGAASAANELLAGTEAAQGMELQIELQRGQHEPGALDAALQDMGRRFPASLWYARALHEAGDEALIDGDTGWTETYFDRLSQEFPRSVYGPNAAWQAAWAAYRRNETATGKRLEDFVAHYPRSSDVVDALYWRGIWAQGHHQPSLAQVCFRTAAARFAGTYFGMQARQLIHGPAPRLKPLWLRGLSEDPATPAAIALPARLAPELQRADWLASAGLIDLESRVLNSILGRLPRGGASLSLARRVARVEGERQQWQVGLAAMLRAIPNYLDLQPRQLPRGDWLELFPRPYPADVAAAGRRSGVSSALLYGIMRQESGFDPNSVSAARARGLMQLELGTARPQWRRLPPAWRDLTGNRLQAEDLLNPSVSIALGTAEIGSLLKNFGEPALALAGYNAGANRVGSWQAMQGKLPANEFIESIPFAQTRAYVQGVLRNEQHYRRLYGTSGSAE